MHPTRPFPILSLLAVMPVALMVLSAAPLMSADDLPSPEKMQQRIEDLRKVKLLDILDLKGDQVEKFFAVYNKHQKQHEKLRQDIDAKSKELQVMIEKGAQDAELSIRVEELRKLVRDMGKAMDQRFDEIKSVLSTKQYAKYVVFEARFRDELQRMIIERIKERKRNSN
jgi:Spy/CpxP family protein refolding chaperone